MHTHAEQKLGGEKGLALLLAVAALVRLAVGLDLWRGDPLTRVLHSDPAYYDAWARALADGGSFFAERPFWFPPLYPYLLAALYELTGGAVATTLIVQSLLGVLWTALLVVLGRRTVGRRAALAAGWLWTFYAPVVFFETRLLALNAALPLCLLALLALVAAERALREERAALRPAFLGGLACGLAALARPNLLLAGPIVALVLASAGRSVRGRTALALGGLLLGGLLGVAPSAVHNARKTGEWIPVSANGGVNFWFGNNPDARGTFHAPSAEWGAIGKQRDVSLAIASAGSTPLTEGAASEWWFARGRAWIAEHPSEAVALVGRKLADSLSSTEFGIQYFPAASRWMAPLLWIPALPFGVVLALGVLGLRGATRGRGVLLAWIAAGLAASLLYFTYSRFRLPILLAWMPFAGRGAVRVTDLVRARIGRAGQALAASGSVPFGPISLGIAVLLLVQSFVPFEGSYPAQLHANSLVDAGSAAAALGDSEHARTLIEASLERVPVNPKARVELGGLARRAGHESEALEHFRAAWNMPGAYPPALSALAQLEIGAADLNVRAPDAGIARLRRWLDTASSSDPFRSELTVLLAAGVIDHPALALAPDEARTRIDEVLAREPENSRALDVRRYLDAR